MAMSPIEIIDYSSERFEQLQKIIKESIEIKNYDLALRNYNTAFKEKLTQGLIAWRIGLNNPRDCICELIDFANKSVSDMKGICPSEQIVYYFPIEDVMILSKLVGKSFSTPYNDISQLHFHKILNFALANSLQGNFNEEEWQYALNKKIKDKRAKLPIETYKIYHDLLLSNDMVKTEMLVKEAEKLFLKREKNAYYRGSGDIEGGGPGNDITVDFRLSAILKHIGYEGDSIHLWRWD